MSESRPAIVGVGNVLMGDDGVGPAVIDELRSGGVQDSADLIDAGLAFGEVLCDLDESQPLVIVDAVRGGGRPGRIYRLTLPDLADGAGSPARGISLHEVNVLPSLRMAALSGRRFADVTIFGIEPGRIDWGAPLSAPVARAKDELVRQLTCYIDKPAASGACAAGGSRNI